jgi:arylsulfatase A-like enzyme
VTTKSTQPELQRAVVEAADTELGRLLASAPPEILADTTVILMGDNGTKREAVEPPYDPLRSKRTVFEGGVRVPLVVAGPHVAARGSRSAALVEIVDLFVTVAELAGVPLVDVAGGGSGFPLAGSEVRPVDGRSLLPYLADPAAPSERDLVFVEMFEPNGSPPYTLDHTAVRDATHKLVREDGVETLYELVPGALDEGPDLLADGVSAEEQAILDALRLRLDERLASLPYDDLWKE